MNNRNCIIYWTPAEPNEAVRYYVNLIEQALNRRFRTVCYTHNLSDISADDVVVTISIMSFLSVWKRNHKQVIIYWWQGIAPEEGLFGMGRPGLRNWLKYHYYCILERICISHTRMNFFVSNTMLMHYQKKYGYNKDNYVIMPCFNQQIKENAFYTPKKYENPSFVYAGSLLAWQCVDEALQLYALVKRKYPNASITLLTKDEKLAQTLITKHHLTDVAIKFVPLEFLNGELAHYKYGMLLRSNDPVNNVATPTKFNSYLAVGVIPIISRVIGDYGTITDKMKYAVCIRDEKDLKSAFEQIDSIEQQELSPEDVLAEYKEIFTYYYNEPHYIETITKKLQEVFPT